MRKNIEKITGLLCTAVLMAKQLEGVPEELRTHFSQSCYKNLWDEFKRPGLGQLCKWKFHTPNESNIPKSVKELDYFLPVHPINTEKITNAPRDKIQVTWLGHASVLTQFEGLTVLADPIFSDFCGPEVAGVPGMGKLAYWRYRKAPCKAEDILKIDAVIISHNHFDHLDKRTVKDIAEKHSEITWFVGMGLKTWMEDCGCHKVVEMEWWTEQKLEVGKENDKREFRFICVPTQHWSQRGPLDKNKTLWCSWIVKGAKSSYYFAGDTGYYQPLFQKIGEKYGPFDLAAIPIGAYKPREITKYQHVDPTEAVYIHKDVKAKQSIGIHWGTFEVTNEFYLEPPREVERQMKAQGLDGNMFVSLDHGETWLLGESRDRPAFMDEHPEAPKN